ASPRPSADPPPRTASGRDFYIDTLRALAIVRVVVYHVMEFGWLTIVFPAMGVMFAIGGSLTARSLTAGGTPDGRVSRSTTTVMISRFRRLLPSVWVFGTVGVIAVLGQGYSVSSLRDHPGLLWWIFPLSAPAQLPSDVAWAFTGGLWYLTTYLWLVLLTPLMLRLFRSWPHWTLGVVVALPVILHLELLTIGGAFHPQAYDLTQYAACWLIGIAHREGWLARVPALLFWPGVGMPAVVVGWWFVATGQTLKTVDLHEMPVVNALWSAAFAAAVLRLGSQERTARLVARTRSVPLVGSAVRVLNARALTIYLWHLPCVLLAHRLTNFDSATGPWLWPSVIAVAGTALAVVAVGWVEDVAARRPLTAPWRLPGVPAMQRPTRAATPARNEP
ncbi:MAG: acyltransferase, partial [Micromonosporaceae bacterium]|nr:acyltransferase [Micromonosporaceae bacterium]